VSEELRRAELRGEEGEWWGCRLEFGKGHGGQKPSVAMEPTQPKWVKRETAQSRYWWNSGWQLCTELEPFFFFCCCSKICTLDEKNATFINGSIVFLYCI
jgi:hypothetical protein